MMGHGFGGSLEHWHDLGYVNELSKEFQLILFDARGHGSSDKPYTPSAYSLKLMVSDLVSILDDLKIRKAHFFGYSMGGRIGFRIPIHAPERFESLILGGAVYPLGGKTDAEDNILLSISEALDITLNEAPARAMEAYIVMRENKFGPIPPVLRTRFLINDPRALVAVNRAHRQEVSPRADEVLPRMTLPCLVFVGDADPRLTAAEECASLMPGATFLSLPGLNHLDAYVRSELVVSPIRDFLSALK
jgi:pimeloyl-ACP methyl ester carboxylesterase